MLYMPKSLSKTSAKLHFPRPFNLSLAILFSQNTPSHKKIRNSALLGCLSIILFGCGFQQYIAKPLDTAAITSRFENKNTDSEEFRQFLISNGYTNDQFPIRQWGADELTYCALFFHPSLDVARAQWRAAEAKQAGATEKPIPAISSHIAHSNNANEDISPFSLGLSIDIPIETANKRAIRIENATHLSQAAKFEVAQTAWQLRNQVTQALLEYQFNLQQTALLTQEQSLRQEIVAIFQKRHSLGMASNVELSTAKLQLQAISTELNAQQQNKLILLSSLANHLGLPLSKVETMQLSPTSDITLPDDAAQVLSNTQNTALLNRLDIRIALERYAAAEAKLKLEIAKQYPDIILSPGYAYEFGDRIWSLGLSGLLTLLNKNKIAIAEATQLREVEATQFEALQNTVIAQASNARAKFTQAKQVLNDQKNLFNQQRSNTQRISRRLSAGEIDRLELTYTKLEEVSAEKNVALANHQLNLAMNQLENALQLPLKTKINQSRFEELAVKK